MSTGDEAGPRLSTDRSERLRHRAIGGTLSRMRMVDGVEVPRVLTPSVCANLGLTRAQVRTELKRGNWHVIARGVILTRPEAPTRIDWADAGLALAGPTAALSGWDALRRRGIGDRTPPHRPVLVLCREARSRTVGGVHIRRTDRPFTTTLTSTLDPVLPLARLVDVPRAVADAAIWCRQLPTVRALVASVVQRGACDLAELAVELDACPRNGSGHLRNALNDIAMGARSAAEADAVDRLRRARVPAFELNVPVVDGSGCIVFVVDVLWRELRAVLEIDSRECHFSDADWRATMDRHNWLTRHGLSLAHSPPTTIRDRGAAWLNGIEEWLRSRAAELGVPYRPGGGPIRPEPGVGPRPLIVG